MNPRLQKLVDKGAEMKQQMWKHHDELRPRRQIWLYAVLRVFSITLAGIKENRIFPQAAALSFSTLLGLGPMVALTVLLSGFVLDQAQPDIAQTAIEDIITFIAPQLALASEPGVDESEQDFSELIARFIESSQSGTVGIGGTLILIFIVIMLFTTIEETFNAIWGVRRGRNVVTRVIIYWTIISLGALLFFAGLAFMLSEAFKQGTSLYTDEGVGNIALQIVTRVGRFILITAVLSFFYRFIPNTQVEWKSAIIGAIFAVICFFINNTFAFLYIERVAMQRTLYGSLGILPVLMIGLYFFWVFLLLGGRLCFAVQNVRFRGGKIAWDELSYASKESLCLLLLSATGKQFRKCKEPLSSAHLAAMHGLPRQLVSAGMHRLCGLGLASALPPKDGDPFDAYRYQPARPLEKIKLADFKKIFECHGDAPDEDHFDGYDPLVKRYHRLLSDARAQAFSDATLATLLDEIEPETTPRRPKRVTA